MSNAIALKDGLPDSVYVIEVIEKSNGLALSYHKGFIQKKYRIFRTMKGVDIFLKNPIQYDWYDYTYNVYQYDITSKTPLTIHYQFNGVLNK